MNDISDWDACDEHETTYPRWGSCPRCLADECGPILIGCEESQTICGAFREAHFEPYSCAIQPTRGNPDWHYQRDIMEVIPEKKWAMIILHPDCTKLAVSGNRHYGTGKDRHQERIDAFIWTLDLWELACDNAERVALENPVSVIFPAIPAPVYYYQPWQFGHGECKMTGFACWNLPPLKPTNIVEGREQRIWKMAPGPNRKRDRSETFSGISAAIVDQWGGEIINHEVRND